MTLGEQIVVQARTYLDVPWFHTGRNRRGIDCIGLLACVAHDLCITDHDDLDYAAEEPPERLTATLLRFCELVALFQDGEPLIIQEIVLRTGDLLQFSILGAPRHCGILAIQDDRWTVIHAYQSAGKVVEHPFDVHWRKRLFACYRLREPSES